MDSSYSLLLDALRVMESRLEAVIVGHGAELELRVASTEQRATEHAGDTNLHINLDDAPDFDADPDVLDDGPAFDTEPVPDRAAATGIQFTQSGSERCVAESEQRAATYAGDFTTMCSSAVFNMEFATYDEQFVFDAEYAIHEEPVFHDRPLFDEESAVYDTESVFDVPQQQPVILITACSDFVFNDEPVFDDDFHLNANIVNESVLFPGRATAPLLTPDVKQSDGEVDTPAKCSTK
jgi:hypothetical protein